MNIYSIAFYSIALYIICITEAFVLCIEKPIQYQAIQYQHVANVKIALLSA